MKIWVTGIAGFLGSHVADALIAEGHEVSGNDALICGDRANIPLGIPLVYDASIIPHDPGTFDCRDYDEMLASLNHFKPNVLVHCAATAHEGLSSFSPSFITKNIYEASVTTFSAAIAAGVKRIVFMSSMSRYGNGRSAFAYDCSLPFREEYHIPAPVDPYAVAKVAAEDTLKILAKTHDVQYSILVPHNIIGIRQRYNDPFRNVASIMINRCLQGKPPIIYGDGSQTRCFSPVADCIPSILKAIHGEADGEVVNIGPDSGEITIKDLADLIIKLTDFDGKPIYKPDRPNEVKHAYCSSDKARRLLQYEQKQSLEACLAEMVADIKIRGTKEFDYSFPIEIEKGCPEVWMKRLM